MLLHQVQPTTKHKIARRVGRGGKRGSYSGRGVKGQKAHAGRRIPAAARELIRRLPKLRGYKNKSLRPKDLVVNVGQLDKVGGRVISVSSLFKAGIIKYSKTAKVKILGDGEVTKSFEVVGVGVSKSAKEKIEKAGGKVVA